jgi:uncharacterized protein YlxW (UPF0749 family)
MDPTFLQFIATATGTTGLAAFAIWLLNQARKDLQALVTQYAADNREDKILLLRTLDDASKAQTILSSKIDSLASAVAALSRNGTKGP